MSSEAPSCPLRAALCDAGPVAASANRQVRPRAFLAARSD
jgi:hypothetical protein